MSKRVSVAPELMADADWTTAPATVCIPNPTRDVTSTEAAVRLAQAARAQEIQKAAAADNLQHQGEDAK